MRASPGQQLSWLTPSPAPQAALVPSRSGGPRGGAGRRDRDLAITVASKRQYLPLSSSPMRFRGAAVRCGLSLLWTAASCGSSKVPGVVPPLNDAAADQTDDSVVDQVPTPFDVIHLSCGDGVLGIGEECDDGNLAAGDGCTAHCRLEERAVCPAANQPCHLVAPCGDSTVTAGEACDDGNSTAGDGCSADCASVEEGWLCVAPGRRCVRTCAGGGAGDGGTSCGASQCGDGITSDSEECDDGASNDDAVYGGCTTMCRYGAFCGDGVVNGPEACDLGTSSNRGQYGDPNGCTTRCLKAPYCGDAIIQVDFEQCDQGPSNGSPGSSCTQECHLLIR